MRRGVARIRASPGEAPLQEVETRDFTRLQFGRSNLWIGRAAWPNLEDVAADRARQGVGHSPVERTFNGRFLSAAVLT